MKNKYLTFRTFKNLNGKAYRLEYLNHNGSWFYRISRKKFYFITIPDKTGKRSLYYCKDNRKGNEIKGISRFLIARRHTIPELLTCMELYGKLEEKKTWKY